ncbi:MAG TPA: Holliday junction resolvase RuvX [Casimicrobiaceae bacterium]|nr:Holliday junction resolvase RuvX [Casimicrobiaceae bacterium]
MTATAGGTEATVLAFDFGTRRIGVAVGNTLTRVAHPLATVDAHSAEARFAAVAALVEEWRPERLIVGVPTHADGTPHAMTAQARAFADAIGKRHALPADLVDERWTSEVARDELAASGRGGRAGRAMRDEKAAQIILQAWFDETHDVRRTP